MAMRARLLLVGTPVMLAGSGLLLVAAARERWAAACPFRGDHETDACLDRQSSLYDFLPPTQPWVGFGHDAALAGAALLVLAVAAACLPALMLGVGDAR